MPDRASRISSSLNGLMIAVIIFIHDLLFHAAVPERNSNPHASPGTPSPKPNNNPFSFFFRALKNAQEMRMTFRGSVAQDNADSAVVMRHSV